MKISIFFGSKSDQEIYQKLNNRLTEEGQELEFHVLSAHRDAEKLEEVLKTIDCDLIIGGAGLAAHLPGVIASKTFRPVLGMPVKSHFDGLDSFCSILQMPYGVPVLSCYPENVEAFVSFIKKLDSIERNEIKKINLVVSDDAEKNLYLEREIERTKTLAETFPFPLEIVTEPIPNELNIIITQSYDDVKVEKNGINIFVPVLKKDQFKNPKFILNVMEWTKQGGVWAGVNNTRNAYLAFMEILNHYGRTSEGLREARKR